MLIADYACRSGSPQLYLTVVGIDKDISLRCNEHLADMAAELLAYGYVLKIGSVLDSRPVAVTVIWNLVLILPSGSMSFKSPSARCF